MLPFWDLLLYKCPKTLGMVHFLEVAEFMDDHVVLQLRWQKEDLVVEVQVATSGAASPSTALFPYSYSAICVSIEGIVALYELVYEAPSCFFVFGVIPCPEVC